MNRLLQKRVTMLQKDSHKKCVVLTDEIGGANCQTYDLWSKIMKIRKNFDHYKFSLFPNNIKFKFIFKKSKKWIIFRANKLEFIFNKIWKIEVNKFVFREINKLEFILTYINNL